MRNIGIGFCLAVLWSLGSPTFAHANVEQSGYLAARDGTRLRYHVIRPDGPGPFPVAVNYEGYAAGSNASDNGVGTYTNRLLARGYAVMGVSVRGTGCSQGEFDPFDLTMGTDGYDAIEWAAAQPWSDGRVGMIGVSFGGITQVLTAATQPPHLKAIAPSSALSDLYRDVTYPGGILEYDFTFAWTFIQKDGGSEYALLQAPQDGDAECTENWLAHEQANAARDNLIPALILDNPYTDDRDGLWGIRSPYSGFDDIEVPTYLFNAWQDEQLPGRIFGALDLFARPDLLWADFTNGNHGRDYAQASAQQRTLDFLDRFVRDVDNGFEEQVAHLTLGLETKLANNEPSWRIERDSVLLAPGPRAFYLRSGGELSESAPAAGEAGDSYGYPLPASDVLEPGPTMSGYSTGQFAWKAPVPPGGSVAYTTPPLSEDLVVAGPASLDLWLQSTAADTDVQATVTEVRPDGQETYVQRGWLRASHRALDPERTTALRPYHPHTRAAVEPLPAGEPALMRLEVFPFAHAFRKGSSLRVWIEAPTGHTGFWAFTPSLPPALNTIGHDAAHPSRLVVGELAGETAQGPLPACDTLRNQPCRTDPVGAVPSAPARATRSSCRGGRLTVSLRRSIRSGVVRVAGRRVATLGGRRRSATVRVPRGGAIVTVTGRSRGGRAVHEVARRRC